MIHKWKRCFGATLILTAIVIFPGWGTLALAQTTGKWFVIGENIFTDRFQFMYLGVAYDRAEAQDQAARWRACVNLSAVHAIPEPAYLAQLAVGLIDPTLYEKIGCLIPEAEK